MGATAKYRDRNRYGLEAAGTCWCIGPVIAAAKAHAVSMHPASCAMPQSRGDVAELELKGLGPGEAHGQEGEPIPVHLEHAELSASRVGIGTGRKLGAVDGSVESRASMSRRTWSWRFSK